MTNQDKVTKGRSWDQVTGGTTSAATMGAGSTGEVGASAEHKDPAQRQQPGSQQQGGQGSAGRTDDLLAGGANDEQSDLGFQGDPGNRQTAADARRQGERNSGSDKPDNKGAATSDDERTDQGQARHENR